VFIFVCSKDRSHSENAGIMSKRIRYNYKIVSIQLSNHSVLPLFILLLIPMLWLVASRINWALYYDFCKRRVVVSNQSKVVQPMRYQSTD
jgi:hypothetical protein